MQKKDNADKLVRCQIGQDVKRLRLKRRLTQEQLGAAASVDKSAISKIERGGLNPSIEMLSKIATGLEASLVIRLKQSRKLKDL